ncbi:MAG: recombination mediator RecR [Candidatus Sumerlaeia bacterium]
MATSPLNKLIEELSKWPGIGRRTAERLALHIQRMDVRQVKSLVEAIEEVKARMRVCSVCGNLGESDPCAVCGDERRDHSTVCVVEQPQDVWAFEKTGDFHGVYHVLGGRLSPLRGVGPEDLSIGALLERVRQGGVREVILATNPDMEGETTAMFLAQELEPLGVAVTRIGLGLPMGGSLEFADQRTLQKALQARQKFSS